MLLLYYIILSILELSISFSVLYDCVTVTCNITLPFCLSPKIKKSKKKIRKEKKRKIE